MEIHSREEGSITIIAPIGDVGLYNLGKLRTLLHSLRDTGKTKVILDLAKVPGIDSMTIGFLIQETELFAEHGGALRLANVSSSVRKSLLVTETLDQLQVYDELAAAQASFSEAG